MLLIFLYSKFPKGISDKFETPLIVSSPNEGLSGLELNLTLIKSFFGFIFVGFGNILIFVPITLIGVV